MLTVMMERRGEGMGGGARERERMGEEQREAGGVSDREEASDREGAARLGCRQVEAEWR